MKSENETNNTAGAVAQERLVRRDLWNKCDVCGRIISYADLASGKAIRNMKTPDSEVSFETWETICRDHYMLNAPAMASADDKTPPKEKKL